MARHFGPQCIKNGYADMGPPGTRRRPSMKGINSQLTVAEAIARARHQATAEARRSVKKKK